MQEERMPLVKLTSCIYRSTQAYTNEVLGKYQLGSGTYPFLLTLDKKEGINQNQISKELDVDKAMSARAIKKLTELEYIRKEADHDDSRAFKLFLTQKAKLIIPEIKYELRKWDDIITQDLSESEKDQICELLKIVLSEAKKYTKRTES